MVLVSRVIEETLAHRAPGDLRDCLDHLASLDAGAALELMVPVECQESLAPRVTVALMACQVCQGTKDIGVTLEEWDRLDLLERMERGEMMETLDPEDSQVNQDLVVCLVPKDLLVSQDLLACVEMMVLMALKEIWALRESLAHLDSRVNQELREWQDHREPQDLQARRDPEESPACQECLALMAPLVTQGKRGLVAPKETRDPVAPRGLLVIPALGELRENKEFAA